MGHSAQQQEGTEGERGLGATVLGGVAGAFFGHKALKNHGTLGAIGGLVLGAVAANAFEHHEKEKNERKEHRREERDFDKGTRSVSRGVDEGYDDDGGNEADFKQRQHHHHHYRDENYDDGDDDCQHDYREAAYSQREDYRCLSVRRFCLACIFREVRGRVLLNRSSL